MGERSEPGAAARPRFGEAARGRFGAAARPRFGEAARGRFGEGPLGRAAALIYTLLVVELLLLLTTVPGLIPLVLLDRDASNLPLVAVCAIPVGPGWAAALFALHHRSRDLTDLRPASAFWRGYWLNAWGVLRFWVLWLAWLTIIAITLVNFSTAGLPGWWAALLIVIGVAAVLWGGNALAIASLFDFRTRDIARLAAYFLGRTPGVPLGTAGLLIAAAAVVLASSEAVLALLGSVFAVAQLAICRPMITRVREEFTA